MPTDRRRFLRGTAAATGVGLAGLSGCLGSITGSGDSKKGGSGGAGGGDASIREDLGLQELDYELEGTLNVLQWGQYWPEDTVPQFEKAYGVDVNVSNFASNDELYNKLKAGGTEQYDLVFPSDNMVTIMANQGMLGALDTGKIPNYDNLIDRFQNPDFDPKQATHTVPYQWGTTGIGWTNAVTGEGTRIDSWDAMWNEEWAGSITMLDSMRSTIGAGLKRLGYSLNTKDEAKLDEAKEILVNQKDLLLAYDSSTYREKLENEQASPVQGWSGAVLRARSNTMEDGTSPVHYTVPKEGSAVWTDSGAMPKGAKHPNAAHAFMNYYLNGTVGASISNLVRYASPNKAAKEHMDDELVETVYPDDSTLEQLEYFKPLDDANQLYNETWSEIKNA